jgi:tight adherence protein B
MIQLLLAALAAGGAGFLAWALLAPARAEVDEDIHLIQLDDPSEQARLSLREQFAGPIRDLTAPLLRGQRRDRLQLDLNRADLNLRSAEWVLIQLGVAGAVGLVAFLRFGNILAVLVGLALGYIVPQVYLRRRQSKRRQAFQSVLGDTISMLSNSVKAGYSVQQALGSIGENGRQPLAEEVGRVVRETSLGIDLETALEHANERLDSKDFDLLVTAILIHRTVGGNLAEVLDRIADTIRERIRVHGEVRVLTSQARASGYIITALPFAVAGILTLISPSYEVPLFTQPLGWGLLALGLASISIGYALIRRITDIHL